MERADLALQLHAALEPRLKESAQERVFYEVESPLILVLAEMENAGHPPRSPWRWTRWARNSARSKHGWRRPSSRTRARPFKHRLAPSSSARSSSGKLALAKGRQKRPETAPVRHPNEGTPSPRSVRCTRSSARSSRTREGEQNFSRPILARCPPRSRRNPAAFTPLLTSSPPPTGPAQFAGPQSAEYSHPHRHGPRDSPRLCAARRRASTALRRLLADRAAHPRGSHAGRRPDGKRSPAARTFIAQPRPRSSACRSTR